MYLNYQTDNEYYVIRTQNTITTSQVPLTLTLAFDGFLNLYNTGLFTIKYSEGNEFNGYILLFS